MSALSAHIDVILLTVAALIMLALLALVFVAARRDGGNGGAASAKALRLLGAAAVRRSFARARKLIERNLATRAERYNLSWTMLLNEGAGAPLPLHASGLQSALSEEAGTRAAAQGLDWQFFDKGVVIQLRSAYLGGADTDGVWDDLVGLCRKYRPQRPLDCIVLAIPASQLLDTSADGQLQLLARAKSLHRRLWLAQNRLALRFPLHVVISECETIPGFASFAAALPHGAQRSILGWASPHELAAPYRSQWVDNAVDQMRAALADSCAELCALESGDSDSSGYFLVAGEIDRLRAGLTLFCDELMRPSAYHESFLLRGIYATGDCSAAALLRAGGGAAAPIQDQLVAPAEASTHAMPAFLRDIFERKIFAEVGLVRTSAQRMRQPAVKKVSWALLFLLPLLWALALVFVTLRIHGQGKQLVEIFASRPSVGNGAASATEQRTLDRFAALGPLSFRSVFMPGSLLDPMQDKLNHELHRRFAAAAVFELRGAAVKQLVALTQAVGLDGNGQTVDRNNCTVATAGDPAAALNLASMPQYGLLDHYLRELSPLADALAAIERLESAQATSPGAAARAPSGRDLAQAVLLLFQYRLADGESDRGAALERMARLYREAARSTPADKSSLPSMAVLRAVAQCGLREHGLSLQQNLFENNPLLKSQVALGEDIAALRSAALADTRLRPTWHRWEAVRAAFDNEQRLMTQGQGEWMALEPMQLGAAYTALLKRIDDNPLLGAEARLAFDQGTNAQFGRFMNKWRAARGGAGDADSVATLTWSTENKAWMATPERKALRDAIAAFLGQPFLKTATPAPYPVLRPGAALLWDKGELERAASLIDARKAFRAGPLLALPADLQPGAAALADAALLAATQSALAQGMKVVDPELPSRATDADRLRVLALRDWMESIGARAELAPLDAALTVDAITRLRRLDQLMVAAQLYMPRDPAFDNWHGKAAPLQDAFGVGDANGVLAYVEQQKEFIDTLVRQGDGVIKFLGSGAAAAATAPADVPLVQSWQRQSADLQLYNRKSPLSARLALETFIVEDSSTLDGANCADKLAGRKSVGGDIYGARLQSLITALMARCRALTASDNESRWQQFAVAFNGNLARRAPFVAPATGAGVDPMPAERDAVAAALRDYALAHAASVRAARDREQPGARAEVKAAEQDFTRVRDLLAPLFPADDSQPAALDLSMDFRVNKGAEQRANTIIDWTLAVGPATLRQGEAARALRWEPGMAVALSLRLARDGVLAPDPGARQPNMTVVERTVSLRFTDPWALFTFVQSLRVPDPAGDDGRAPMLRVEFPVVAAGTAVPAPAPVQLFLRVRVRAPGKQTTLPWPAAFPEQLPLWHPPVKNPP